MELHHMLFVRHRSSPQLRTEPEVQSQCPADRLLSELLTKGIHCLGPRRGLAITTGLRPYMPPQP
eukprot:299200-Pyramimonas_sp.AAC.1